jgi:hypothetical protein
MAAGQVADLAGHASSDCPREATVTGAVLGVTGDRSTVQSKAVQQASFVSLRAALAAWAVILEEGAS